MKSRRIKIKEKYSKKKMKGGATRPNGLNGANATIKSPKEELALASPASSDASTDAVAFLKRIRAALMTELSTSNEEEKSNVEYRLVTALRNTKKNKASASEEQSQPSEPIKSTQPTQAIQAATKPEVYKFETEKDRFVYKTLDNRISPRQKNAIANFLIYYKSKTGITSALLSKTLGTGDYFTQDQYEYLIELSREDYPFEFSKILNDTLIYIREKCMKKSEKNSFFSSSTFRPFKTVRSNRTIDNTAENTRERIASQTQLLKDVDELLALFDTEQNKLQTVKSSAQKGGFDFSNNDYNPDVDNAIFEAKSIQLKAVVVTKTDAIANAGNADVKQLEAEKQEAISKNDKMNTLLEAISEYKKITTEIENKKQILLSKTAPPLSKSYLIAAKELGLTPAGSTENNYDPFASRVSNAIDKAALLKFRQIIERAIVLSNKQLAKDQGLLVSKPIVSKSA